jgi:hypothetical protein
MSNQMREYLENALYDAGLRQVRQHRSGTVELWGLAGQTYGVGYFIALRNSWRSDRKTQRAYIGSFMNGAQVIRRKSGLTRYLAKGLRLTFPNQNKLTAESVAAAAASWCERFREDTANKQRVDKLVMSLRRDVRKALKNNTALPDFIAFQDLAVAVLGMESRGFSTISAHELLNMDRWNSRTISTVVEALCLSQDEHYQIWKRVDEEHFALEEQEIWADKPREEDGKYA